MTIFRVMRELERARPPLLAVAARPGGASSRTRAPALRRRIEAALHFPDSRRVEIGFERWTGCDVAMATGWQTAYPVLRPAGLPGPRLLRPGPRARVLSPRPRSTLLAERTYRLGHALHRREPVAGRAARASATAPRPRAFELGRGPRGVPPGAGRAAARRHGRLLRARLHAPARASSWGCMALQLLLERGPGLRIVLFGTHNRVRAPFAFEQLGVESTERLRRLYSEATVGLSLSLTNYSLIPNEMLACGLPVVELAGRACESVYGDDGSVITLADADPARHRRTSSAALLDDDARRERGSRAGLEFVRTRTWAARDRRRSSRRCKRLCARGSAIARGRNFPPAPGIETFRDAPSSWNIPGVDPGREGALLACARAARFAIRGTAPRIQRFGARTAMTRLLHPLALRRPRRAALAAPAVAMADPEAVIRDCSQDGSSTAPTRSRTCAGRATTCPPTSRSTASCSEIIGAAHRQRRRQGGPKRRRPPQRAATPEHERAGRPRRGPEASSTASPPTRARARGDRGGRRPGDARIERALRRGERLQRACRCRCCWR